MAFDEPTDVAGRSAVVDVGDTAADIDREYAVMRRRDPATHGKVTRSRNVNGNRWTVAGTGVMTRTIRHFVEDGYGVQEIIEQYPSLVPADITAAVEHERGLLSSAA